MRQAFEPAGHILVDIAITGDLRAEGGFGAPRSPRR
jgi:hypothetical protein